ncbi:hypothetical protein GOA99_18760 [Sinorhizobium meliloti]|nr:hypothetical protein [Sinorhizobium meliloti]
MGDNGRSQVHSTEHGEITLDEVEALIHELPNEYKFLAIFVFATAAAPEVAINLEVGSVNRRIARLGNFLAMQSLSNVPTHPDWELLLPVYINGRRAALLKRKNIPWREEPPQVYLDRNARPFTLKKVNRAFLRLSKKLNLPIAITLETIASAVARQSMLELSAMPQHEPAPIQHYWHFSSR